MRRVALALPAAIAGALLLPACGSSPDGVNDPSCGKPAGTSSSALPGNPSDPKTDGVKIVGAAACPAFEVTNEATEAVTYTITFQLLSSSGAALESSKQTVPSVKPGQTVQHAVDLGELPGGARGEARRVKIIKVRSVPTAEAPTEAGPCPPSGVRVYVDDGDAAMGLRAVGLHLTNCGTDAYRLNGYPQLQLLDEGHELVDSVRILHGGDTIATGTGADVKPQPLVLRPGESARAGLIWRNTTGMGSDPMDAPYVRVVAKPGADAVMVTPELDLGTTGKVGVGAWQRDDTSRPAPPVPRE
ncbi:DUF4232 domain-containing protein [Streptomyces colonosanans]|uniref:DUF4232 domain-containing protein n=1 Tax=Streptomyces colonosanans TaxID=1428652 RepID=A0A1S2NXC4_9ACTN|nr:DUF4232 domain-containing protein [Streptomyces colonosanans]OIJ85825.1 hypothetical protein BIV24_27565 [Streptomyces colonosanans]